ncbi:MAG: ABC transporter [Flammeovirgaceae bacterium]|nr:ABC transporter [Flammeovirgaceae bacterium]MBR09737.1 ABC transporter [Rickettsiales bacterium]MBR11448.1 ABC transporter [Rickettsiales bacterium]
MKHLKKYKDIVLFLWKYGDRKAIQESGMMVGVDVKESEHKALKFDKSNFIKDIQDLGPTFIKLGQLLSTRPDLLSAEYIELLSQLQDDLDHFPYEEVEEIVKDELGVRISKAYAEFDKKPLAAASLGQVHKAKLRDGREVVVKIQRPGIRKRVVEELEILEEVSSFLEKNTDLGKRFDVNKLFLNFKGTLLRELDYHKEAQHMNQLHENLKGFESIVIATSIDDYSSSRVLTMEFIKGQNITKISPLRKLEIDGEKICEDLFEAYLQQIVVDGFMHADPHPGNVYLTEDNKVALLDLGMVAHISNELRQNYLKLILHISEGRTSNAIELLAQISRKGPEADEERFRMLISDLIQENQNASVDEIDTGKVMFGLITAAGQCDFHMPLELSLVGKALLNLDLVAHTLAPGFNPNKAIRKNAMSLMNKIMYKELKPQHFFSALLEGKELLEKMPERLNKIIGNVADNNIKVKVDAFDERQMMKGFQKVANRITVGLILAALVIGSALMMNVQTDFTLFGYPGIAIVSFLLATTGAIALAIHIFFYDES